MNVLATDRLSLRWLTTNDAEFILQLVNEPAWLQHIGDRDVKTLDDARAYLEKGPMEMYRAHGFGLYLVELKESQVPIGICGLIKRESLEDVDLGFALLSKFWSKGYAFEAASSVLAYGKRTLGISRIVAVTSLGNDVSIKLLEKLGFRFERLRRLSPDGPEIKLYAANV